MSLGLLVKKRDVWIFTSFDPLRAGSGLTSYEDGRHLELFIFARFHARRGQEGALAAALRDEVDASRAEPGCLVHEAYHSTRDPRLFFIHSRWVDQAAFQKHAELPHTVKFLKRVDALLDQPRDVTRTEMID
jgi:quinol monooxygenase YgiN